MSYRFEILHRTVSEYSSARGATEPYPDDLLNRTRNPSEPYSDKEFPLEDKSFEAVCFLSWVLNWESTENWDFHRLEPYPKPYSDTVRLQSPQRSFWALRAKVGNGVENEFRRLPAPGSKKVKSESKKSQKVEISTLFQLF